MKNIFLLIIFVFVFTPLLPGSPDLQTGEEWRFKIKSLEKPRSLGGVTGFTCNYITPTRIENKRIGKYRVCEETDFGKSCYCGELYKSSNKNTYLLNPPGDCEEYYDYYRMIAECICLKQRQKTFKIDKVEIEELY